MESPINEKMVTFCKEPTYRLKLLEEVKQLTGLKKLRMRVYGPEDREILHLDEMIRERRVKLYGTLQSYG